MGRDARSESTKIAEIADELTTLRVDQRSSIEAVLPAIRELLETDSMLCMCPVERSSGWALERFDHQNFSDGPELEQRFISFLAAAPRRYAWYDATRPEPEQRNRVLDALDIIPAGEYEASRIYAEVMAPLRLQRHRQLRVLICDGPSLLAWFGAFHDGKVTTRQRRILRALVPAVRQRLSIERRLDGLPRIRGMLETALEKLGAPAFVADARGRIYETNTSGAALLASRHVALSRSVRDRIAGRPAAIDLDLTPVAERGGGRYWLAILRTPPDERSRESIVTAARAWSLTRRQYQVLELIVAGQATTTIAATLGTSERAVEFHITALFDRAGVDSRAALVARVMGL